MAMTYGDLLKILLQSTQDELEQHVTVFQPVLSEFYPVVSIPRVCVESYSFPSF